jgi:hypothetical protein
MQNNRWNMNLWMEFSESDPNFFLSFLLLMEKGMANDVRGSLGFKEIEVLLALSITCYRNFNTYTCTGQAW